MLLEVAPTVVEALPAAHGVHTPTSHDVQSPMVVHLPCQPYEVLAGVTRWYVSVIMLMTMTAIEVLACTRNGAACGRVWPRVTACGRV